MNKLRRFDWLALILSLLCSLAALVLVVQRVGQEQNHKTVCPLISYEDLTQLAQISGLPREKWCESMAEAGVQGVLMTPNQMKNPEAVELVETAGLSAIQAGGIPREGPYFFDLRYDESNNRDLPQRLPLTVEALPSREILEVLEAQKNLVVLVERESQTGLILPKSWDASSYQGEIAKGYWLNLWCRTSVGRLGYSSTEETENILYRAVIDRGIQVLWITPVYTDDQEMIIRPSSYVQMLSRLEKHLQAAGYAYGPLQGYGPYEPSLWLLLITGLAVLLAGLFLVSRLLPLPSWAQWLLLAICIAENIFGFLLVKDLQITLLSLGVAVCYPCLSVTLLWYLLQRTGQKTRLLPRIIFSILLCCGLSLLGGLIVAALQSSRDYILVLQMFHGVKLSQTAVYVFSVLFFVWMYFRRPGHWIRDNLRRLRSREVRLRVGIILAMVIVVGVVFLLRTGDNMMSVSILEQRLRNWLEHVLLFRPRTKELLLAWPALALAFFFAKKELRAPAHICGAVSGVGFASIVNTYCHSRAHVLVSLARTGFGLAVGLILALILLGIAQQLWKKKPWKKIPWEKIPWQKLPWKKTAGAAK